MKLDFFKNSLKLKNNILKYTFLLLAVLSFLNSCSNKKNRPLGYIKLGKVSELNQQEIFLDQFKLLLRQDEKGFYVMSTICTYDLTYLEKKELGGKSLLVSNYTDSKYDLNGIVVSGPSTFNLPYYELTLDSGSYEGPKDTLYVYIGKEVPPEWRLKL